MIILIWHTIFHVWWICVLNVWNRVRQNAFERFKTSWWKFTSAHEDDYHRVQNGPLFTAGGEKTHIDGSYPFWFVEVLLVALIQLIELMGKRFVFETNASFSCSFNPQCSGGPFTPLSPLCFPPSHHYSWIPQ